MAAYRERRIMPEDIKGGGLVILMAKADGYAMIRRPRAMPFVVDINDWNEWPLYTEPGRRG